MSSKSLFTLFTAGLACFAPLASAYTKPTGDEPKGNPISQPGLNSVVPVGKQFSVTWDPTTKGTVTLVLLKGPSTDAEPQYAIAEKIDNSGIYAWTPKDDLEPGETGYGIQLIDDSTGQYQYTTQFGISNPDYDPSSASSYSSSSESWSASSTSDAWETSKPTMGWPGAHHEPMQTGWSSSAVVVAPAPTASSGMPHNITMVAPTGSMTVPASLKTSVVPVSTSASESSSGSSTATATPPMQTGAASTLTTSFAGLVFAAGVAVFAL